MSFICFVVICVVIEYIAEKIYMQTARYKSTLGGADKFFDVPYGLEICNVGSGPAHYGIDYKFCKKKGFNFSTAPQNFYYGYKLLQHFSSHIKENAIIIIIIMCPMSFGCNQDTERKGYSDKFYGILKKSDIIGYSLRRRLLLSHPLVIRMYSNMKAILKRKNIKNNSGTPSVTQIWKKEFNLKDLKDETQSASHLDSFEKKMQLLREEVTYCLKHKWKPIFVTPPIPKTTRNEISEEFVKEFSTNNIDVLVSELGIKYLNYYDDKRFDNTCFTNDIFVNEKGKKLFSKILFNDIMKIY